MALHTTASTLWLIAGIAQSLADRGALPDQTEIQSAAANLHNQILQYQRSLGLIVTPDLPANVLPPLTQLGDGSSFGLSDTNTQLQMAAKRLEQTVQDQQMSSNSQNLQLASQRLALQQELASAQLEQAGVTAHNVLGNLRQAASEGAARRTSLLSLQQQPRVGMKQPLEHQKEPLALPQTVTQLWRQKNPALAALLLEPVLYGYSVTVWAIIMFVTGISSALCFQLGNKLPFGRAATQRLIDDGEAGRLQPSEAAQNYGSSRPSQYFQYPGSTLNRPPVVPGSHGSVPMNKAAVLNRHEDEAEEEAEGVESWIRVPVQPAPQSQRQGVWRPQASSAGHSHDGPGYLDEVPDGEIDYCFRPPSGRYHPCGYVDEQ